MFKYQRCLSNTEIHSVCFRPECSCRVHSCLSYSDPLLPRQLLRTFVQPVRAFVYTCVCYSNIYSWSQILEHLQIHKLCVFLSTTRWGECVLVWWKRGWIFFSVEVCDSLSVSEQVSPQSQTDFNNASVLFWENSQSTHNLTQINSTQNKRETTEQCITLY